MATAKSVLKVGDVVRLNSGSPRFTVVAFTRRDATQDVAECLRWDGDSFSTFMVGPACLTIADDHDGNFDDDED